MQNFTLAEGLYLYPTPAGAYYAVAFPDSDKPRRFLLRLLQQAQTPALALPQLQSLMEIEDEHKALEMLLHCQKLGWVQGVDTPLQAPAGALEDVLPGLLAAISESGKVLLADDQGFYLPAAAFRTRWPRNYRFERRIGHRAQTPLRPIEQQHGHRQPRLGDSRCLRRQPNRLLADLRRRPPFRAGHRRYAAFQPGRIRQSGLDSDDPVRQKGRLVLPGSLVNFTFRR